jgi:hypothetical protein
MKRLQLMLVLAVVLLGLLAAPALAAPQVSVQPWPPSNVAILLPLFPFPGEWAMSTNSPGVPGKDVLLYQASDPTTDYAAVPNEHPDLSLQSDPPPQRRFG